MDNSLLEARADREGAMAAAGESVYTGPVTPLSTTSTAMSAAGPMQAKKKGEAEKNQGEQFEEAYREMKLPERVRALRDLSIGELEDNSPLKKTYNKLLYEVDKKKDFAFMEELIAQQSQASNSLGGQYSALKQRGGSGDAALDDDEAYIRTKYSKEAMKAQGFADLVLGIARSTSGKKDIRGKDIPNSGAAYDYYVNRVKELKEKGEFNFFANKMNTFATNRRVKGRDFAKKNLWGEQTNIGEMLNLKDEKGKTISNENYFARKGEEMYKKFAENRVLPQSKARKKWLAKQGWNQPAQPTVEPRLANQEPASVPWNTLGQLTTAQEPDERKIKQAYQTIAQEQSDVIGQSQDQIHAFSEYITDSTAINGYLRGKQAEHEAIKGKVRSMDAGMQTVGSDLRAYRGVSDYGLIAAIQQNEKLAKTLLKKDKKTGQHRIDYRKLEKDPTLLNGLEFSDAGYNSTSLTESYADQYRQSILKTDAGQANQKMLREKYLQRDMGDKGSTLNFNISLGSLPKLEEPADFDKLPMEKQHMVYSGMKLDHEGDYTETTEDDLIESGMGSHLYDISVPQGTRGTAVDKLHQDAAGKAQEAGQTELLLDRGTRFKVTGMKKLLDKKGVPLKNQYRIMMEVIGQEKKEL